MIFWLWKWLVRFNKFLIHNLLNIVDIEHHIIYGNIGQACLFLLTGTFLVVPLIWLFFISQITNQIMQFFFPNLRNLQTMLVKSFDPF